MSDIEDRLRSLENKLNRILEAELLLAVDLSGNRISHDKKPHKCPVCDGMKCPPTIPFVENSFYNCRACEGKGIVWG